MRTLSARILLGFTVLTLTIAGVTTNIVINQRTLEKYVEMVNREHLPLSQQMKELARRAEDLRTYLAEGFDKEPNVDSARIKLDTLHQRRNKELASIQKFLSGLGGKTEVRDAIEKLQVRVDALRPHYDHVELALRRGEPLDSDAVNRGLAPLRDGERQVATLTAELSRQLERNIERGLRQLQDIERQSRTITIALGAIAVAASFLVTIWVVFTLRPLRRLREAARRVAAGQYGDRIEEKGPTEVVELAREFNSMGRAIEERERELVRSERLAAVGKMAAMITHEVRNPLSSIGLNTELLQDELEEGASSEEAKKLLRAIHREVDRLTAITEEYLAFARMPKPKPAPEAINPLVGALAAFVREDLAAKQVKLTVELGDGDPIALVDGAQIRQCLINLVRNASEALSGKGGGSVVLRTRRADQRILIDVADDGVGIPADVLPRMFDPFFSTKEGGSGLGLALTQQIVKDHGGDLLVQSTVGKGTTFTVSVPAKPA